MDRRSFLKGTGLAAILGALTAEASGERELLKEIEFDLYRRKNDTY